MANRKNGFVLKAENFNAEAVVKLWEAFAGAGEEICFWNAECLSEKLTCFLCFFGAFVEYLFDRICAPVITLSGTSCFKRC